MTLVSSIISDAYRESQLVPIVSSPTTNEAAEGLRLFNTLLLSTVGNEAGSELHDITIGGTYDQSHFCSSWVPCNSRLILNLAAARSFSLDPRPYEGQRIAIADAGNNLATRNLTLTGNRRQIEGASSLVLSTNGDNRQWLYRSDTGNWVRITALSATDTMPLPGEFDDYFIVSLALRLNPRHRQAMAQESVAALERQKQQIRARYRRPRPKQELGTLGLLGQSGCYDGFDFNPLLP